MENLVPDLTTIVIYGSITFYQVLGFLTFSLSFIDAVIYGGIIYMFKNSKHAIGSDLKLNFWLDLFLMMTTMMMGLGALFVLPSEWWQFAYVCRVGILVLTPIVSIKLAVTCYRIIKQIV